MKKTIPLFILITLITANISTWYFVYVRNIERSFSEGYFEGVKSMQTKHLSHIRDPTLQEALSFVTWDKTDQNVPSDDYNCFNFVHDFKNNAFHHGYRCGFVYLNLAESAHGIVCFNTTDEGLIFIEPQTDETLTLTIGQQYWNRDLFQPTYNDTLLDFQVIW